MDEDSTEFRKIKDSRLMRSSKRIKTDSTGAGPVPQPLEGKATALQSAAPSARLFPRVLSATALILQQKLVKRSLSPSLGTALVMNT